MRQKAKKNTTVRIGPGQFIDSSFLLNNISGMNNCSDSESNFSQEEDIKFSADDVDVTEEITLDPLKAESINERISESFPKNPKEKMNISAYKLELCKLKTEGMQLDNDNKRKLILKTELESRKLELENLKLELEIRKLEKGN